MTLDVHEVTTSPLPPSVREAVLALAAAASAADGASSLSEDAVLRLSCGTGVTHVVRSEGDRIAGYAQLVGTGPDAADGALEGELLVHPDLRRRGHGSALLAEVDHRRGGRDVRLWAHGDTPGAAALAADHGWRRVRELLRMERPTAGLADLPVPGLPGDVTVRPFAPGDERPWVTVNAAAFAAHPEQGRWTLTDLQRRLDEPWFDARLLLLAESEDGAGDRLAGFCWMKVEQDVGELYVLGVAPDRAGAGLGKALLVRGLRAVATGPAAPGAVELYVDGDNVPAVRLYSGLGFTRAAVDVQYASPAARPTP